MPITYRAFARISSNSGDVTEVLKEQFKIWLANDPPGNPRNIPVEDLIVNALNVFPGGREVLLFESKNDSETVTLRARLTENQPSAEGENRWISTLTMHESKIEPNSSFLLFEVDSPIQVLKSGFKKPVFAKNPRFISRIMDLNSINFLDGEFGVLNAGNAWIEPEDLGPVIKSILDPLRRGVVTILGGTEELPKSFFLNRLKILSRTQRGISTMYALSPESLQDLNAVLGKAHAVEAGSIRTFMPSPKRGLHLDGRRHPYILATRIDQLTERFVAETLESSARKTALESALPLTASEIVDLVNIQQNALIVHGRREYFSHLRNDKNEFKSNLLTPSISVSSDSGILTVPSLENALERKLISKICGLFEINELSDSFISDIFEKLVRFDFNAGLLDKALQESVSLQKNIDQLNQLLNGEKYDHLETFLDYSRFKKRTDYLMMNIGELVESDVSPDNAQKGIRELYHLNFEAIDQAPEIVDWEPSTFTDLMLHLEDFKYVEFTGEAEELAELDKSELGRNPSKAWSALKFLNDYARSKAEIGFKGGPFEYASQPPDGYFSAWATSNLALQESMSVRNDPSMLAQRTFTVPNEISADGRIIMLPHLKIGSRLRLHFYDCTSQDGKVYVGYIGNHLETRKYS